jgi:hypothetical protein
MPRLAGEHAVPLRALIERSLLEHPVHPALGAQVVEMANDLPRYRLVLQPGVGPKAADETPNYRPLKPQYDAVLEMTVTRVGLLATEAGSPLVALELDLRARIVRVESDGAPWVREWTHSSVQRSASDGRRMTGACSAKSSMSRTGRSPGWSPKQRLRALSPNRRARSMLAFKDVNK